jgi:hypothetical protein
MRGVLPFTFMAGDHPQRGRRRRGKVRKEKGERT